MSEVDVKFPEGVSDEVKERTKLLFSYLEPAQGGRYCYADQVYIDLIKAGICLTATEGNGYTVLNTAIAVKSVPVVELLLDQGADIEKLDYQGHSPLGKALMWGCPAIFEVLINRGADFNKLWGKQSFMEEAVTRNIWPSVKLLIDKGVDTGKAGFSAMHVAAIKGEVGKIKELLAAGADVEVISHEKTPMQMAAIFDRDEVISTLFDNGASIGFEDMDGYQALHIAAEHGSSRAVRVLMDRGADIEARSGMGRTPLHVAGLANQAGMIHLLFAYGANIEALDYQDSTSLYIAVEKIRPVGEKALMALGANVNPSNQIGNTVLICKGCYSGHPEAAKKEDEELRGFYKSFREEKFPPQSVQEVYKLLSIMPVDWRGVDRKDNLRKILLHPKWNSYEEAEGIMNQLRLRGDKVEAEEILQKISFVRGWRERVREEIAPSRRMV